MQTVYILKNCIKSYTALVKLYKIPSLLTNIIIVGKKQVKILLKDKRIKEFPFIINSLPNEKGLIPKTSRVLPLKLFLTFRHQYQRFKQKTDIKRNRIIKKDNIQKLKTPDGGIEIILNK